MIVSNGAASASHIRELRGGPAEAPAAAETAAPAETSADYWAIPAAPDLDEGFLYTPATTRTQAARPAAETAEPAAWAPFDGVTLDDIARATPESAARLFSYSLW
ncbi:hypothetical protein RDV64_21815 [Acuticoccus sp. MNP-M23]|uniref:hypothetical protein n=1 Tax=Acuticoccus sp. MNP-M23 TaxID=3072793 RepID=UPI00281499E8|nr:hypothetical protein [Acuticoccus sp. MNP-M23]WMS42663.1 hypothetical protein RDV64_21815 [Acuticoccus sp. MNP-M23]